MAKPVIPILDHRLVAATPMPVGVESTSEGPLRDVSNRPLRDLRISVTDRCNFRCVYCMPKSAFGRDHAFLPRDEVLSFEEIERVVRLFVARGGSKVRLTGGEPLLRRNIEELIARLAAIPDVELTLTTNGSLLRRKAAALKSAGLQRVTISLDSIDDTVFRAMNDVDFPLADVLDGIDAAAAAGLAPLKINMVVKRGVNDHTLVDMARHFRGSGHILRFIEFMDVGATNGWQLDSVVPSAEVVARIGAQFPLQAIDPNYEGEVAERWRYEDGSGEIGVISSVTQAFCSTCTRLRLSTDGKLYTCLFADRGHDLRSLLRSGASDTQVDRFIAAVWQQRGDRYSEIRSAETAARGAKVEMSYIGG